MRKPVVFAVEFDVDYFDDSPVVHRLVNYLIRGRDSMAIVAPAVPVLSCPRTFFQFEFVCDGKVLVRRVIDLFFGWPFF